MFTAPSQHMQRMFSKQAGVPIRQICHLPYGLDTSRLSGRKRPPFSEPFVFGYFGRHSPEKGIHTLVKAAYKIVRDDPTSLSKFKVIVWGHPEGQATSSIIRLADELASGFEGDREAREAQARWGKIGGIGAEFPQGAEVNLSTVRALNGSYSRSAEQVEQTLTNRALLRDLIELRGGYDNRRIVPDVLDHIDCAVLPSISRENYPITILEVWYPQPRVSGCEEHLRWRSAFEEAKSLTRLGHTR